MQNCVSYTINFVVYFMNVQYHFEKTMNSFEAAYLLYEQKKGKTKQNAINTKHNHRELIFRNEIILIG